MKVLYIGYHRENSDWGFITRNNILALDRVGVDVTCRGIDLDGSSPSVGRILELEQKDSDEYDVCIQHVFPSSIIGSNKFKKNIAILSNTFTSISHSTCIEYLQQVDEVWVPNTDYRDSLPSVLKNVKVLPQSCDTDKFKTKYQELNIPQAKDKLRFYAFVDSGDINSLDSILSSFHAEFDYSDQASLILIVTNPSEKAKDEVNQVAARIKETLRLNKDVSDYTKEIIITDQQLQPEHLMSAHQYGHCFINLSNCPTANHGINALGLGSKVILTNFGGSKDLLNATPEGHGYGINYVLKCSKSSSGFMDINCGKDFVCIPSDSDLRSSMRSVYEGWKDNPVAFESSTRSEGFSVCQSLSIEHLGSKMKEILND